MEQPKLNFAGKIAQVFVKNTNLTLLVILSLFAWGVLSFVITPKEENPQIVVPAANVITYWPGGSAEEVEMRITSPLEDKIKSIAGIEDVYSVSYHGMSVITARFIVGEEKELSMEKLYDKLMANRDLLPPGVEWPIVKPIDIDDVPILVLALHSDNFSNAALKDIAEKVGDTLKLPSDVSFVDIYGGLDRRINIYIDPQKLEAHGISIVEIMQVIKQSNVQLPLGDIDVGDDVYLLEINNQFESLSTLKSLIVAHRDGDQIALGDIAEITDGYTEQDTYVNYGSHNTGDISEAVFLAVAKKKGVNAVTLTDKLLREVEGLKADGTIPASVSVEITRDSGQVAGEAVNDLLVNLIQAIIIVLIVLLLFLGFREAAIVAVAIPLTISSVFGIGLLAGQTINRITLFALILSLGMLVDSAIVVVENISRHIKMRKKRRFQAVIEAVNEVGFGLLSSTITTVLAFIPMAFVTGMMGPYMAPIPFNTPAALITSFAIALIVTPWLAFKLIKHPGSAEEEAKKKISRMSHLSSRFVQAFERILLKAFRSKKFAFTLVSGIFGIFLLVMVFPLLPIARYTIGTPAFLDNVPVLEFKMLPKSDKNQFTLFVDLPVGTNVESTKEAVGDIEDYLLRQEYVENFSSFIGTSSVPDFNGLLKGASNRNFPYQATIAVNIVHKDTRDISSQDIVIQMRPDLYDIAQKHQARIKLIEDPPGPPVRSTVLAVIYNNDFQALETASNQISSILRTTDGIVGIDDTYPENHKKLSLHVNWEEAQWSKVPVESIAQTLAVFINGYAIDTWHQQNEINQVDIWMEIPEESKSIEILKNTSLQNTDGEFVPIHTFTETKFTEEEPPIFHENQQRVTYVYGEMETRSQVYAVFEMQKKIKNTVELPDNTRIEWKGEWDLTKDVFRDLGLAMAVAVFLIYLVLVAQFQSFTTPMIIMSTIPLAMIGIIPGFMLVGLQFNATSMIGVIALAGIVVNNAIIMLEYVNGLRKEGRSVDVALIKGAGTRMRPILLTSLTTSLGSITIALGDEVWAGLGWAIIWGMIVSTALTLFVFPILYHYIEGPKWKQADSVDRKKITASLGPSLK